MSKIKQPDPAPPDPVAEPAVTAEPVPVGVLSVLRTFAPSAAAATYSANMGRDLPTMLRHVSDNIGEALNMLRAIAVDAACANDPDSVSFVNNLITRIS
jgi:hypothetical protein